MEAIINNPVRIVALVAALLVLLTQFGVPVSEGQQLAILDLLKAILEVAALLFAGEAVRANVNGPVTAKKLAEASK